MDDPLKSLKPLKSLFTGEILHPPENPERIDLRQVERKKWDDYLCFPLLVPPSVQLYIDGIEGGATTIEKDYIEEAVEHFLGIKKPYAVVFRKGIARLMKE